MVLGDSHLGLDLQFGVQEHPILKALVHENYNINDNYHYNDIGGWMNVVQSQTYRSLQALLFFELQPGLVNPSALYAFHARVKRQAWRTGPSAR